MSPKSKVYTDDARAYNGLVDYDHEAIAHSLGECVRDNVSTNGIESFWSMLKRGYVGTYHKMSFKHLHRYIKEFTGRHNIRPQDTIMQMSLIAHHMTDTRLRYRDLVDGDMWDQMIAMSNIVLD